MAALPQGADSVVVVRSDAVAVYDHGNQRPNIVPNGPSDVVAALDDQGSTLYRLTVNTTVPRFDSLSITSQGIFPLSGSLSPTNDILYYTDWKCAGGTCVIGTGIVIDAVNRKVLGTCPIQAYASVLLDPTERRSYFLIAEEKDIRIVGCSLDTFSLTSQFVLPAQPQVSGDLLLVHDQFIFNTGNEVISVPKKALGLPPPQISAVVNAGSYLGGVFAPLSIVTVFGSNFAAGIAKATSFPLASSLAGVSATVQDYPCFPLYVSPNQINLVLPSSLIGNSTLTITVGPASATTSVFYVAPAAPGIFTVNGNHAVAQNQDYTANSPSAPAASGSVVTVYFTGQGNTVGLLRADLPAPSDPARDATVALTSATIGGLPAMVLYSGAAPGMSGVGQANIQVPNLPSGDHPLVLTVGGASSNGAAISVK
jgi:uncharacterized protein (TIGR03437 family)